MAWGLGTGRDLPPGETSRGCRASQFVCTRDALVRRSCTKHLQNLTPTWDQCLDCGGSSSPQKKAEAPWKRGKLPATKHAQVVRSICNHRNRRQTRVRSHSCPRTVLGTPRWTWGGRGHAESRNGEASAASPGTRSGGSVQQGEVH